MDKPVATDRRKLSNAVVDSQAQLRLFIPFGLLFVISVVLMVMMYLQVGNLRAELTDSADLGLLAKIGSVEMHMLWIACIGDVVLASITLVTWLMYSHRIFGPMVPIRRRLNELIEGKYEGKIRLRKNDEFKAVAEDINRLTERLAQK